MPEIVLKIAAGVAGALALAGIGYLLAVLACVRRFLRRRSAVAGAFMPPVSILKPLKGTDPQMYECFRSHCVQDYPEFEIIFGVNDEADPAVAEVERLKGEFPNITIRLVVCDEVLGTNRKVSNLVQLEKEARFEYMVVNDGDIRVSPDYLKQVTAPFADSKMGLVSTLYRAIPGRSLASRLEALAINTEFAGGILIAIEIEHGMKFALGSTLAFTRESLQAIGGFAALVDHLADDYELGNRIASRGYETALAATIVETFLPDYSFSGMFHHQLRWARTIRDRRAAQYVGLGIVYALPWSLMAVVLSGGAIWAWYLLAGTLGARLLNAYVQASVLLSGRNVLGDLWLVPVRDCIALAIWVSSFFGSRIEWRGETFRLSKGKLYRG